MQKVSVKRVLNYFRYVVPKIFAKLKGVANMKEAQPYLMSLRPLALQTVSSNAGKLPSSTTVQSLDKIAAERLAESGTIVHKFLDRTTASKFGEKLLADSRAFSEEFSAPSATRGTSKLGFDVVIGNTSMTALIGDGTPIANIRRGTDEGMVDFYNIDNHYPEALAIRNELLDSGLKELLEDLSGKKLYLKSMNAYVNIDVTDTRGFHVDAFGVTQIKVFVYLTDVLELKNGPYCYVLGSHREKALQSVNSYASPLVGLTATDLVLLDFSNAYPILGPAGTLIVSDQSGAHRGFPQEVGGRRALCVFNFFQSNE